MHLVDEDSRRIEVFELAQRSISTRYINIIIFQKLIELQIEIILTSAKCLDLRFAL